MAAIAVFILDNDFPPVPPNHFLLREITRHLFGNEANIKLVSDSIMSYFLEPSSSSRNLTANPPTVSLSQVLTTRKTFAVAVLTTRQFAIWILKKTCIFI
jgi:hypothetical protein